MLAATVEVGGNPVSRSGRGFDPKNCYILVQAWHRYVATKNTDLVDRLFLR